MGIVTGVLRAVRKLLTLALLVVLVTTLLGTLGQFGGQIPIPTDGDDIGPTIGPGDGGTTGDSAPTTDDPTRTTSDSNRDDGESTRTKGESGATDRQSGSSVETTAAPRTSPTENPWRDDTVVVAVENSASADRNVTRLVAKTLDYWETHDDEYAAYSVDFVLKPDAEDPDVVVSFTEAVQCSGHTEAVAGCAPVLNETYRPTPPETVEIEAGHNDRSTLLTLKHEFGHVLGIRHCHRPLAIMGSNCPGGVDQDRPDATDRPLAWQSSNLTVYVDSSGVSHPVNDQIDHALTYYERGADGTVPEDLSFTRVDRRSAADVVVRFGDSECGANAPSCFSYRGRDVDGDGRLEYYVSSTIVLSPEIDRKAVGWHAGYGLGYLLGAEQQSELPPPFVNAGYGERRSDWWR
ncbi:zinc metalloprotease [Halorussus salinisoli]|uniref:matrixin n=1 Tax=Halorussus salinisoli TaxID=2558242 RepID=UPI0010C21E18|nr:matrixin [Halorussus salinisoli]